MHAGDKWFKSDVSKQLRLCTNFFKLLTRMLHKLLWKSKKILKRKSFLDF